MPNYIKSLAVTLLPVLTPHVLVMSKSLLWKKDFSSPY